VEVGERLERLAPFGQVAREARRREHAIGGERGAAVGVPVADVDDLARGKQRALARLAADVAVVGVAPLDPPAVGPRVDAVRVQFDVDSLAFEDGLDQLFEPARDDVDVAAGRLGCANELGEPRANLRLVEHPADDLVERSRDRDELADDHLPQRQPALVEAVLDLLVDGRVAELERDPVEQIGLGDRAVEVEDDGASLLPFWLDRVTHPCEFPRYDCDGEEVGGALK
jgi:hypothetical protein